LVSNTSTPLQTTLTAEAHQAERLILPEEQTLLTEKCLIYQAETRKSKSILTTTTTIIIIIIITAILK
jgi:hypothetical protein